MSASILSMPAPVRAQAGLRGFVRAMFSGWLNTAISLACIALVAFVTARLYAWGVRDAVFAGTSAECRASGGACWAFIGAKLDFAVYGFYPFDQRWRVTVALALFAAIIGVSLLRRFWRAELLAAWVVVLVVIFAVLRGGAFGLSAVPVRLWSGLLLTVWLSVFGIAAGYPVGLALALGRRSVMPLVQWFSIAWIELVRGVPLVSILIMASVVLPLFLPEGADIDNLFRAQVAFTMFAGAYLAEVFRGGLQAVPVGQAEGAQSLGLGYWQTLRLIVLPQALKLVIPAQVNTFIAIFKDTSLVLVIGLFDFLGTIKAMLSDTAWLGFSTEGYLFGASVYFVISYGMSRYSRHLEQELNPERTR
jgi:general L-amino acid transport system permease protein